MDNIRQEMQDWLELNARVAKGIPFGTEVIWEDIEDVANGEDCMSIKWEKYDNRTYHWVHSDAVSIDHMCQEILDGDFNTAMEMIKRYRNIVLTEKFPIKR
jgi:hypothetical protein